MTERTVWQALSNGDRPWNGDADRLATELANLGAAGLAAFEDALERSVALLETPEFAGAARRLADDGTGISIGGTALEFLRYAVIAAGRERFEAVVADPEQVAGVWSVEIGEDLEAVADRAAAMVEVEIDDGVLAGSTFRAPTVRVNMGGGLSAGPDALERYREAANLDDELEEALRIALARTEWVQLVRTLRFGRLRVMLAYMRPDWEPAGTRLQQRGDELTITVTRDASCLPAVVEVDLLRSAAAAEVAVVVEIVGEALRVRAAKTSSAGK